MINYFLDKGLVQPNRSNDHAGWLKAHTITSVSILDLHHMRYFCIYNDTRRAEEDIRYLHFLFQEISETCIMYYVIIIDPQIGFSI
jgi:hypothetical protein